MTHPGYSATANKLADRIEALISTHPELLSMTDPWGLFKIKEFECDDLEPSAFQAGWALVEAQRRYKAKKGLSL